NQRVARRRQHETTTAAVIHLKAFGVGLVAALLAATLWIVSTFVVPLFAPMLLARLRNEGGASGAFISSDSILVAALVGFVVGYVWTLVRPLRSRGRA